jgi:hypothetical protein
MPNKVYQNGGKKASYNIPSSSTERAQLDIPGSVQASV